jgi:hypothetical protein
MPLSAQHERERTLDGGAIDLCITQAVAAKPAADDCQRRSDCARICANASTFRPDSQGRHTPAGGSRPESGSERTWSDRACTSASVESRCGAVALGRTYLLPPLSSGGASMVPPWFRFHIPLIEPDRQISRIRLSDKTSRLRVQRLLQLLNIYWS